ncbi:pentatricopeptide repeat-containing protein [Dorcoceras hygrometricum]|uniref:Pentatricopeptide repeat-containing protein n=1 Tax=Dorcoceras hygrometricum TaxID=472368 RepID=A0A2Z7D521_9LAMI|nr:pentatricopeptide repeat-containing protein [Dorcoceras hygrometricum]
MQIDSDLVIYRTTLLRTFQVVPICRVDKSEIGKRKLEKQVAGPPPCAAATTMSRARYGERDTIARWPRDGRSHVARWPRDTSEVAGRFRYRWPRHACRLAHSCTIVKRRSRAPCCAKIAHGGRCASRRRPAAAAPRLCYWLRKMLRYGREVTGLLCTRLARDVDGAPRLVAAACALAAHVIFVWRPPAGRRSGESPTMS